MAALHSLRDRLITPKPPRSPAAARISVRAAMPGVDRVLAVAASLFDVSTVALVLAAPEGLVVEGAEGVAAAAARDAACRLFETLATSSAGDGQGTRVLERVVKGAGFSAATPVLSAAGRCRGALCLLGADRHTLLSGLQRRIFAEIGDLLAARLEAASPEPSRLGALKRLADAEPDGIALFDADGRCLLRNARFDALLASASFPVPLDGDFDGADGCEPGWLSARLMRERAPVGVYRAALADGAWLSVEERRGPRGRSLLARIEEPGQGDEVDAQLLFDRCPSPMFVFERDTRAILAVNAAALALYGWEREAFLRLGLDSVGPVPQRDGTVATWTHRTRDGRDIALSGRATALDHRGRAAMLVTVIPADAEAARAA